MFVVKVGEHCRQGAQGFGVGEVALCDHYAENPHNEAVEQVQKVSDFGGLVPLNLPCEWILVQAFLFFLESLSLLRCVLH